MPWFLGLLSFLGQTGLLLCLYVVTPDARQSCEPSVGDWLASVAVCVPSAGKMISAHGGQFACLGGNLRTLDGLSAGLALDGRFAGRGGHLSALGGQYTSLPLGGRFAGLGGHVCALGGQYASLALGGRFAGLGGHLRALGGQ